VNGTVNDLAVSGAEPRFLSASFILEEGFPLSQLAAIVDAMARAAATAGVKIVTGDTKVVERGHGDGCYINTAGVGLLRPGITVGPHRAQPGDAILVSGTIGDHGMAIMSVREGLEFESQIRSDCAALNGLIAEVLAVAGTAIHAMRDPTRGGLASTLNEIAQASSVGVEIDEPSLPVRPEVQSACELLGWTRSTWPTRARRSSLLRPTLPTRFSPSCGPIRWAGTPLASVASPPNTSECWWPAPPWAPIASFPPRSASSCRASAEAASRLASSLSGFQSRAMEQPGISPVSDCSASSLAE